MGLTINFFIREANGLTDTITMGTNAEWVSLVLNSNGGSIDISAFDIESGRKLAEIFRRAALQFEAYVIAQEDRDAARAE